LLQSWLYQVTSAADVANPSSLRLSQLLHPTWCRWRTFAAGWGFTTA